MNHVVYSRDDCVFCEKAKNLLTAQGFKYEVKDVYEHKEEFKRLFPDAKTVPQIIFYGKHVGGYNELVEEFDNQNIFIGGSPLA